MYIYFECFIFICCQPILLSIKISNRLEMENKFMTAKTIIIFNLSDMNDTKFIY